MISRDGMSRWWGPVFDAERITRSRRWQGYALRSLFVLGLLAGLILVWSNQSRGTGQVSAQQLAEVGASAYRILVILELTVVLAVAPAATAGAICLDKARGTLAHVFVTDLTNREIILGKLAARLLPVLGLLACTVPVAALATWLGGIDPVALLGSFVILAGLAVLGCSFALMLSVWASKPQEALTVVFSAWTIWLLALPTWVILGTSGGRGPGWLELTNPFFLAFAPYSHPGETSLVEPTAFALVCTLLGAIGTAVAIAKVRVVGCRSPRVPNRRVRRVRRVDRDSVRVRWFHRRIPSWGGPQLDGNPVLWREWHRNRPSRWSRVVWRGYAVLGLVSGLFVCISPLFVTRAGPSQEFPGLILGAMATLGLLLLSAATASTLAEERARGSLDVLMSTPLATRTILQGKWWGAFRQVPRLAAWPLVAGAFCLIGGDLRLSKIAIVLLVPCLIVAQGAALVSLGLALATWMKRTGQATAWTVAALVTSVVGWPIVGYNLGSGPGRVGAGVIPMIKQWAVPMGSPFYNVALSLVVAFTDRMVNIDGDRPGILVLVVAWTIIYTLVACLLFEATARTFERRLGRSPERPAWPRREPPREPHRRFGLIPPRGWRTPGAAGRPGIRAESSAPPPR